MCLKDSIVLHIDKLCKDKNITINKLCTICGITQSTLRNLKIRPTTNVTVLIVLRICRSLDISLKDFFDDYIFDISNIDTD